MIKKQQHSSKDTNVIVPESENYVNNKISSQLMYKELYGYQKFYIKSDDLKQHISNIDEFKNLQLTECQKCTDSYFETNTTNINQCMTNCDVSWKLKSMDDAIQNGGPAFQWWYERQNKWSDDIMFKKFCKNGTFDQEMVYRIIIDYIRQHS